MKLHHSIFISTAFFLLLTAISSSDLNSVKKAYSYLSKNWEYYTKKGKQVRVNSLKYNCSGSNCSLIVNGRKKNPRRLYKLEGNTLVNLVDGSSSGNVSKPENTSNNTPSNQASGNEPGKLKGFTDAHNGYRSKLNIPGLVWDSGIAGYAQEWANYLQKNGCDMEHRPRSGKYKQKYGENLAWASGQSLDPYKVVKMWHDEVKYYNYSDNSCSSVCGHYTQVVWKNSRKLGCGVAKCGNTEVWVCNYDPPGNWVGEKPY